MHLCGCKLSKNAPFCDGKTCMDIVQNEAPEELAQEEVDAAIEDLESATEDKEEESKPNNN